MRGYKPWYYVVLAGIVLGFFIPRTGAVLAGFAGGLLVIDAVTGVVGILLGAMIKRGESRSRYHKAGMVVGLGILGVLGGVLLLPRF